MSLTSYRAAPPRVMVLITQKQLFYRPIVFYFLVPQFLWVSFWVSTNIPGRESRAPKKPRNLPATSHNSEGQ